MNIFELVVVQPIFNLLIGLYAVIPGRDFGVAIIVFTIIVRFLLYPLTRSMLHQTKAMRKLQPELAKIKKQTKGNRQAESLAMMELYKTEKINPLGGCLPVLVQIPVFIALYWVLLASVELRHAPFMLWIDDLSRPDTLFGVWFGMPIGLLPILMGATMIFQTYLNPEPPDPVQAKIMKIMPIAFSVMFFFFPAGLVLYWLVNNILSIAQQWQITRAMEHPKPAHGK